MHVVAEAMTIQAATSASLSRLLSSIYFRLPDNPNVGLICVAAGVGHIRVSPPITRTSRAAGSLGSVASVRNRGLAAAFPRQPCLFAVARNKRGRRARCLTRSA